MRRLFEIISKIDKSFKPKLDEGFITEKQLKQYSKINNKYTHFAILKQSKKIVNGWDYMGYDPQELKTFKKDYFFTDLIDMDINPKNVVIWTVKKLQREGIDPFNSDNWYKFEVDGWREKGEIV